MEKNGWIVDTSNNIPYWQKELNDRFCNSDSFYGFKSGYDVGTVTAIFRGHGRAFLNFGNCGKQGYTKVFLNNLCIGIAGPKTPSKDISFHYSPGSILFIEEHFSGIIKLNYLKLDCNGE